MKDKFKQNVPKAVPAALLTVIIVLMLSIRSYQGGSVSGEYNLIQTIPYALVLIGGISGVNVFLVLMMGIVSGSIIMLATGTTTFMNLMVGMGVGAANMFETIMVAVLVSAVCAMIREEGGFDALLAWVKAAFKGRRGGLLGMGLLVGAMDVATANNTVAIVMASPIARAMREEYGISGERAASIMDTFSCIFQGILPYGAQMLVAVSVATTNGVSLSALEIIPNLFYPYCLLIISLISIAREPNK